MLHYDQAVRPMCPSKAVHLACTRRLDTETNAEVAIKVIDLEDV